MPAVKPSSTVYRGAVPLYAMYMGTHKAWRPATALPVNAVSFTASGQKFSRSATGINADLTWCAWIKQAVNRATYSAILSSDDASSNYNFMGAGSTGNTFGRIMTGGDNAFAFDTIDIGSWIFVAVVHGASVTDMLYFNRYTSGGWQSQNASESASSGLLDTNTFYIGDWGFGGWWNGSIAAVKVWTAALTQTELQTEMPFYAAQRTANLWASYSFRNGPQTTDDSGNGRTLTGGTGAGTDTSGPPIT